MSQAPTRHGTRSSAAGSGVVRPICTSNRGPPNLHPHELDNGMTEMAWDFGLDRMPGQADAYELLPIYGQDVKCQIHFFADAKGIITKGEKVGCE